MTLVGRLMAFKVLVTLACHCLLYMAERKVQWFWVDPAGLGGGDSSVARYLISICKALDLIPSPAK